MEPVTIVLVDALAANLELDVGDKVLANPVEPAELAARAVRRRVDNNLGERGLEVDTVDQIAVALDRARDLLAEVRRTVERILNRLHREVRVATVDNLEDRLIPSLSGYFLFLGRTGLDYNLSRATIYSCTTHYHLVSELHSCCF